MRCAAQAPSISVPLTSCGPDNMTIKDPATAAQPIQPRRNHSRLLWYRVLAMLLPVLFFLLLEGGLRLFNYGDNLYLFVPAPAGFSDKDFLMVNPIVARRFFTKGAPTLQPPYELFAKQ